MGTSEIAALFGVTRQRASVIANSRGFPEPIATLAAGSVWDADDVEAWAERTGRAMPGREPNS